MASTPAPVVVVGAGLAGLAAARELTRAGRPALVVESGQRPGGRVRTDRVDGFRVDRGFQVLNTGYPELARLVDLAALDVRAFLPGALVRTRTGLHLVADPRRLPSAALATLRAPVGSLADKMRLAAVTADLVARPGRIRNAARTTTLARWQDRGLSGAMVDGFLRPFLSGVLLDRDLAASSAFGDFVWRSFALGRVGVPSMGMGALPQQLAEGLPEGTLHTGRSVTAVSSLGVETDDGPIEASAVIVAADPVTAATQLGLQPPTMRAVTTWNYACAVPPVDRPVLILDGEGRTPILNSAVLTNAAPSYSPDRRALVAASVLGVGLVTDAEVRAHLSWLYGVPTGGWELIAEVAVPEALPAYPPSAPLRRPARRPDGVFVAGDWRDTPSIQGALVSGRRAAEAVLAAQV